MSQIPAQEGHQAQGSPWERGWVQEWDRWGRQRCLCSVVFLFLLKAPVPPSPAETPKIAFGAVSHCELSLAQVSQPKTTVCRSCPKPRPGQMGLGPRQWARGKKRPSTPVRPPGPQNTSDLPHTTLSRQGSTRVSQGQSKISQSQPRSSRVSMVSHGKPRAAI